MTKLEEKLIGLGYIHRYNPHHQLTEFFKNIRFSEYCLRITHKLDLDIIIESEVSTMYAIQTQQDIDNLQQAYNILQSDLEVLKEYES